MKIRSSIIWLIIITALLLAFIIWHGGRNNKSALHSVETGTRSSSVLGFKAKKNILDSVPTVTADALEANVTNILPVLQTSAQKMQEGLATLNDNEIFLYGMVQDQFGMPVANATVSGIIQVNNGIRTGTDRIAITTDANGLFTISGYKGKNLGIHVVKSGYVMAATNISFIYSFLWPESERFKPDLVNPTVIKMWKLQGAEPLVNLNKSYMLRYTNTPVVFDLVAEEIVPTGGDLKITVNRPDGIISQQHPQKWSIQIDVVSGGFIETSGREQAVTFAAPENGYQATGIFGNNNGPETVNKAFFLKSRDGQVFSKCYLSVQINSKPDGLMYVEFGGFANTNSSRNWEASVPQ